MELSVDASLEMCCNIFFSRRQALLWRMNPPSWSRHWAGMGVKDGGWCRVYCLDVSVFSQWKTCNRKDNCLEHNAKYCEKTALHRAAKSYLYCPEALVPGTAFLVLYLSVSQLADLLITFKYLRGVWAGSPRDSQIWGIVLLASKLAQVKYVPLKSSSFFP